MENNSGSSCKTWSWSEQDKGEIAYGVLETYADEQLIWSGQAEMEFSVRILI